MTAQTMKMSRKGGIDDPSDLATQNGVLMTGVDDQEGQNT
jgi:hypothetical protein